MTAKRSPVESTVDTVTGAISMLYDWLGAGPKTDLARAPEGVSSKPADAPGLRSEGPSERSGASRVRPQRIPAVVIDTEGESV